MALSRDDIKAFFELNDVPTSTQYDAFIDGAPNIHDDYGDAPAFTRFVRLPFTAAETRNLNSSPQTIVVAPVAGFFTESISASVKLNFVGPVFSSNQTLQFRFPSANTAQLQVPNILNATVSVFRRANMVTFFGADTIQVVEAEALELFTADDIVSGGSDIVVYLMFRMVAV